MQIQLFTMISYQYVHCRCYAATRLSLRRYSHNTNTNVLHVARIRWFCIGAASVKARSSNHLLLHQPILIHLACKRMPLKVRAPIGWLLNAEPCQNWCGVKVAGLEANGFSYRHLVEEGSWDWFRTSPLRCVEKSRVHLIGGPPK